jgi:hypothetical protein
MLVRNSSDFHPIMSESCPKIIRWLSDFLKWTHNASAVGRSPARCWHGSLLHGKPHASNAPLRFIRSQPVRDAKRPAARSGRQRGSVRVSAPHVVPFGVTNRKKYEVAPGVC